eukprot:1901988-Pyramimonas_sp.AAC.1
MVTTQGATTSKAIPIARMMHARPRPLLDPTLLLASGSPPSKKRASYVLIWEAVFGAHQGLRSVVTGTQTHAL